MAITVVVLDDTQGVVAGLQAARRLDGLPARLVVHTERLMGEDALIAGLQDADVVVLIRERSRLSARVLAGLPRLRLVVQTGRLAGAVDLAAAEAQGIQVLDGGGSPIAPAELTIALILAARRRLVAYAQRLQEGCWQRTHADLGQEALGVSVAGRTLGVWGLGRIGQRVARVGQALGMSVLVHGRAGSRAVSETAGYTFVTDRFDFLSGSDILSLHLKLTPETRGLLGPTELAAMKPDSLLVNTSRAELLAPGALLAALAQGRPGGAALDVYEDEPDGAAPYLGHPRILCTPHLGFVERDTFELYFDTAFRQVAEWIAAWG